jgi:cell division protein FtsL
MRETEERNLQNSREAEFGDTQVNRIGGKVDSAGEKETRTTLLIASTFVLLSVALLISALMILQLREDRDDLELNDSLQTERIAQLEGQIRSLGEEPIPNTIINPPINIVIPNPNSTTSTSTRFSSTSSPTSTTTSTSTTSTSSTTSTTIRCLGPLCVRGERPNDDRRT